MTAALNQGYCRADFLKYSYLKKLADPLDIDKLKYKKKVIHTGFDYILLKKCSA